MPSFSDINFRYTDARSEKLYTPDVLLHAFVYIQSCVPEILKPDKYIVYGSKGSGKTALASYYELKAVSNPTKFCRVDDLDDFDFALLSAHQGDSSVTAVPRTVAAWKFLLSLRLFTLLAEDEALCQRNSSLVELKYELDRRGLLPTPNLSKLADTAFSAGGEAGFNFLLGLKAKFGSEKTYSLKSPAQIADSLISSFKELIVTNGNYILFVDGLDHVLREGRENLLAVGDLINAVRIINEFLLTTHLKAKIVLLIRSELARAIPSPDMAKRLADNGVFIEWDEHAKEPLDSNLLRVIQRRARLEGFQGGIRRMWWQWMPYEYIYERPAAKYILARTRFLPRDVIRFFYYLQRVGEPPFKVKDILAAEQKYSEWFFDELHDSLVGLVDDRVRASLGSILTQLGTYFMVKDLQTCLEQRGLDSFISGEELAQLMFETHWIGNHRTNTQHQNFNIFRSRSRSVGFSSELGCVLSWGLIKGLNTNKRIDQQKKQ